MVDAVAFSLAVASALGYGWLCWRSWSYRDQPAASNLTATFAFLTALGGASAVAGWLEATTGYVLGMVLTGMLLPPLWASFVMEYTGFRSVLSSRRTVGLLVPGAVAVSIFAAFVFSFVESNSGFGTVLGVLLFLATLYAGGLVLVSTALLARAVRRSRRLDVRQGVTLAAVLLVPWSVVFVTGNAVRETEFVGVVASAGFVLGLVPAAVSVLFESPFESIPAAGSVGKESAVAEMDDGLVVLDHEGRIVECNEAAERALDATESALVGTAVADAVGYDLDELRGADTVDLDSEGGRRHYEVTVSAVTGDDGDRIGHTLVLHDVTDRRLRRQRLQVLNRVLRHNLRNDMTSVVGRAEILAEDDLDAQRVSEMAERIHDDGMDLLDVGEKAREVERMMEVTRSGTSATDLAPVVADVVQAVGDRYPGAEVDASVPGDLTVAADSRLLTPTLRNLVENAVEHNDRDRPHVEVVATRDERSVAIEVRDDGPGIPDYEREVVVEGREDSLEHGSGLGLWAVKWGVTRMGGSLTFEDNDPRGTVVRLRIPAADSPTEERGASTGEDSASTTG